MKDDRFEVSDRNRSGAIHPGTESQPTIVKTWLRQIMHRLIAHSPRLICTQCNEQFFAAEIEVKVSPEGVREECPHCHAGSFRYAAADAEIESH